MYNLFTSKKDYRELWQQFVDAQNNPDLKEWENKVYQPGMAGARCKIKTRLYGPELQAEVFSQELNQITEQ